MWSKHSSVISDVVLWKCLFLQTKTSVISIILQRMIPRHVFGRKPCCIKQKPRLYGEKQSDSHSKRVERSLHSHVSTTSFQSGNSCSFWLFHLSSHIFWDTFYIAVPLFSPLLVRFKLFFTAISDNISIFSTDSFYTGDRLLRQCHRFLKY